MLQCITVFTHEEDIVCRRLNQLQFPLLILLLFSPAYALAQSYAWREVLSGTGYSVGLNPHNPSSIYGQGASGGFYHSSNAGASWTLLSNPGIPDIRQIIVHPADTSTIFAVGFSSGLKRSTDGGLSWSTVISNFGIDGESIGLDPSHPDTMYAGNYGDGNIYRTTDRGATWAFTGSTGGWICAVAVRPDSSDILYAGTGSGVVSKSVDRGATWRAVKPGGSDESPRIVIDQSNPLVAYVTGFSGKPPADGLWKTTDGGEHWTLIGLQGISVWSLDVDQTNPSTVYVGTFSASPSAVFKSTDAGITWAALDARLPSGTDMWNIKVHRLQPARPWLALATNAFSQPAGIFRLTQSLAEVHGTVLNAATHDTVRTGLMRLSSTGDTVNLAASGGTFSFTYYDGDPSLTPSINIQAFPYRVTDVPITFVLDSSSVVDIPLQPLPTASISGSVRDSASQHPLPARVILTATTLAGPQQYSDSTDSSGHFHLNNLYVSDPPVVQYQRLLVDAAFPFTQAEVSPLVLDSIGLSFSFDLSPADVLIVTASDTGAGYADYYRAALDSLQLTSHVWNVPQSGTAPMRRGRELKKNTVIFYSGDRTSGLTAAEIDSLDSCLATGCNLLMTGQNLVKGNDSSWLFMNEFGVSHLANTLTATVSGATGGLFDGMLFGTAGGSGANNQLAREVLRLSSGTKGDLFYGVSGTGNFAAGVRVDSTIGGGRAILFGFGFESISSTASQKDVMQRLMGYFDRTINPLGVTGDARSGEPASYALEQNYPNPFNPSTTIRYQLRGQSRVTIAVYDILGREVRTLIDGVMSAGTHALVFDAEGIASGVYFVRMRAEGLSGRQETYMSVKKLMLLR